VTVYVDDVRHAYGRMVMCHMWADDEAELMAMADRIGVARRWVQRPPKASWLHFDISLGRKALALQAGAILTDRYGPVEHLARLDLTSPDLDRRARAQARIESIARIRERHAEASKSPVEKPVEPRFSGF
jgi:hypothetical protein